MKDRVSKEEVRALIEQVFSEGYSVGSLLKMDTDEGYVAAFFVASRIGPIQCIYPLEIIAEDLLRKYPATTHPQVAAAMLVLILDGLPLGLQFGMENVADQAELETQEIIDVINADRAEESTPSNSSKTKARRKEKLKKMDARNRWLIPPPQTGPQAKVSIERLSAVVGYFIAKSMDKEHITVGALANRIGCSESAIYKTLEKNGKTLESFMNLFPTSLDS